MRVHPLAGKPVPANLQVDIDALLAAYHGDAPDPSDPAQQVSFGTSGHRGSSLRRSFNDAHIAAVAQAIADYRGRAGITGPLFIGRDTHALSEPALATALQVFAANDSTAGRRIRRRQ
jgi:phosphoglucomutase